MKAGDSVTYMTHCVFDDEGAPLCEAGREVPAIIVSVDDEEKKIVTLEALLGGAWVRYSAIPHASDLVPGAWRE